MRILARKHARLFEERGESACVNEVYARYVLPRRSDVDNPRRVGKAAKNIPPAFPGFARGIRDNFRISAGFPAIPAAFPGLPARTCYGSKQVA